MVDEKMNKIKDIYAKADAQATSC